MTRTDTNSHAKDPCVRVTLMMTDGALAHFESVGHPDARNREPSCAS